MGPGCNQTEESPSALIADHGGKQGNINSTGAKAGESQYEERWRGLGRCDRLRCR